MLRQFVAIVLACFVGFYACDKDDEEDLLPAADRGFDGAGGAAQFDKYAGQNSTLLKLLLQPIDFANLETRYEYSNTYAATTVNSAFSHDGSMENNFKAAHLGGVSIQSIAGVDKILSYDNVSINTSLAAYDYDTLIDCFKEAIKGGTLTTVSNEFLFEAEFDASSCYADILRAPYMYDGNNTPDDASDDTPASGYSDYTVYNFKIASYGQCYGKDLTELNGKTYAEIANTENFESAGFCPYLTSWANSMILTQKFTYGHPDTSENIYNRTRKIAEFDLNGRSCQNFQLTVAGEKGASAEGTTEYEACVQYDVDDYTTTAASGTISGHSGSYYKAVSTDLIKPYGDHDWYTSGSWDVYYRGWRGTVTYSGEDTPATWKFSKDNKSEDDITGSFVDPDA